MNAQGETLIDLGAIAKTLDNGGLARTVSVKEGQSLFIQDDPGDALYLVKSGTLEANIFASSGKKLSLNIMQPGDVIGEIAVLDGGPRTATVTALEDAELARVDRTTLIDQMRRNPDIALELIQILCGRLRWISQQVEDMALLNTEKRLARRLILIARKFSDEKGHLNLSQSELADFLGLSRESTNKILQGWRSKGLIGLARGSIAIVDYVGLTKIAEFQEP
ncbi:Crp/Fnr family transcriptional regulator [Hwanghaeella grinnelliae]|uniref:Crp/Fnr family transcriptional regulator n=1 Tax=Hwanghaeella grinnelliae TaxID=2500179 RepID=A0A3S2WQY5_9PROT|nr:Crp/Fnr family transcriptional regulator [Hwanghaeella grinnelliae]RVU35765.1 Crp/Fnr family transcriptional regulator [Hwanghaeella grinnelliae]